MYLLLLFLFPGVAFAQDYYFDFRSDPYPDHNNELNINMKFDVVGAEEGRFRIRPMTLLLPELRYWDEMPVLSKNLLFEVPRTDFISSDLWFQIQDIETAEIFETPKHKVYSRRLVEIYISKLNESLFRMIK